MKIRKQKFNIIAKYTANVLCVISTENSVFWFVTG